MFKLINCFRACFTQIFNTILIANIISTFNSIIHMPTPIIYISISQGRSNPTLGRNSMRTRWKYFRQQEQLSA